ncbi:MAG: DNA-directed RNA polymerase subunit alpha C-terminal domain-containing protein [Bacillota bacterium]|uniref:DNA-directed RNA polymerase subunit alpha C-terminal domain-containing protein n=1 Tax=Cytobacillus TaxID=2675230 RepID=UPI0018CD1FA3|nr:MULTISPECIES: DNA-directed RNA polymerase subunit alpha C-terminal domain-containing protein [Cytobacillus]MDK7664396.1 DNA-directed RNA polymerase subunit alpha C-terminal domain-containing protein [Cytobacillus oceanisediminis]MED1908881.1 DNA-directed RNA polymerase subunit alpha C-terminal domain-containing protein [Cytobacillus firmus]
MISRVKDIFDERGIKQSHIVRKYGISATTMSAIYRGSIPTLQNAYIIAQELRLPIEEIWYDDITKYIKKTEPIKRDLSNEPIEVMDFEPRTFFALKKNNINTYSQLKSVDLKKLYRVGKGTIKDIEEKLEKWERENEYE